MGKNRVIICKSMYDYAIIPSSQMSTLRQGTKGLHSGET